MRLGRSAALSDAGRRRRGNEDSFVREPPLFAVADGMGGALAGEIASRLAAAALEEAVHAGPPIDVVAAIREGNRRIQERSLADPAAAGMGTTVTAVLVGEETLSIGHVGDSRAYRLRGEQLEQLTPDHSLVAELVRSGQLTPEEAEGHPQRAVITRALGTDANVDVDAFVVATEPGDLYLLCSDGLTTMLGDADVRAILLQERASLDAAVRALVAAANAAGGEDNITCVCFEIVAGPSPAEETGELPLPAAAAAMALPAEQAGTGWNDEAPPAAELTIVTPPAQPEPAEPPVVLRRHRRHRKLPYVVALLILLALALAAGLALLSRAHFVGADNHGRIVVYQGVPWEITSNVRLYRPVYISPVLAVQLSQQERLRLLDHGLHSKQLTLAAVRAFERELVR
jgi:protein phosphatase